MVGHYSLTSTERDELVAKEQAKLRRLRLLQVRQQAKEHAKKVRDAVKQEKNDQVSLGKRVSSFDLSLVIGSHRLSTISRYLAFALS